MINCACMFLPCELNYFHVYIVQHEMSWKKFHGVMPLQINQIFKTN